MLTRASQLTILTTKRAATNLSISSQSPVAPLSQISRLSTATKTANVTDPASMDPSLLAPITEVDPEIYDLMRAEKVQQANAISLIASENQTSRAVLDALCTALQNRYSEGYPGAR